MICGFPSEIFTASSLLYRKLSYLIFALHILLGWYFFHFYDEDLETLDLYKPIEMYSMYSFFLFIPVVYMINIINSFVLCKDRKKIWRTIKKIDRRYAQHDSVFLRNYFLKFLEFFIYFLTFNYFNAIINFDWSFETIDRVFNLYVLIYLGHTWLLYYLFYLEIIQFELKIVENEVQKMVESYKNPSFFGIFNRNDKFDDFKRKRFIWLREYFILIHQLSEWVNSIFGWSFLVTIAFNLFCVFRSMNALFFDSLDIRNGHGSCFHNQSQSFH